MSNQDTMPQKDGWFWVKFAEDRFAWHLLHVCVYEGTITFHTPGPWNDMTTERFRGPIDVEPPEYYNPFTRQLEPNETS